MSWCPWIGNGHSAAIYSDNYISVASPGYAYNSCAMDDYNGPNSNGTWTNTFTLNQCPFTISSSSHNPTYNEWYGGYHYANQIISSCVSSNGFCASTALASAGAGWCEGVWDQSTYMGAVLEWWFDQYGNVQWSGTYPPGGEDCGFYNS